MPDRSRTVRTTWAPHRIDLWRPGAAAPCLTQHADSDHRPFIHPIVDPTGRVALTEDAPAHHPWQHGLYVGLNDVNGVGFWTEGLNPGSRDTDGSFHPAPLEPPLLGVEECSWSVNCEWRSPAGVPMIAEAQAWRCEDREEYGALEMKWTLRAGIDLTFGQYAYGGLFLRMPYRGQGSVMNSDRLSGAAAEGRRARWVQVSMPIDGRWYAVTVMDHPLNPGHPAPWRVDGELGIAPSRCIAGEWSLAEGESTTSRYRLRFDAGRAGRDTVDTDWSEFASGDVS